MRECMEIFTELIPCVRPCIGSRRWRCKSGTVRVREGWQSAPLETRSEFPLSLSILLRRAAPVLGVLARADHSPYRRQHPATFQLAGAGPHKPGCWLRCQVLQRPRGGGRAGPRISGPGCQPVRCEGGRLSQHWCRGGCRLVSQDTFVCTL